VEAEDERGQAVGQPHRDHAERPSGEQRRPHQRDVLEGVAELAGGDREIDAPKAGPPKQCKRPGCGQRLEGP